MCIAAWVWQAHPVYNLLLFLNRDEYHDRPTEPLGWWGESCKKILGGRDKVGEGTWLGCTKDGRVAFLTNVREPCSLPSVKSRGVLPVRFLESPKSPLDFAEEIVQEAEQYNGFNLILADICARTMVYISNRPQGEPISIQTVSPGLHVLSNAKLDTPWPKVRRLHESFKGLLEEHVDKELVEGEVIEKLMGDTSKANRDEVPDTGVDSEWEFELSSIFVETNTKVGRYGTRSMAALSVKYNGEVTFYERYLDCSRWKDHNIQFQLEKIEGSLHVPKVVAQCEDTVYRKTVTSIVLFFCNHHADELCFNCPSKFCNGVYFKNRCNLFVCLLLAVK